MVVFKSSYAPIPLPDIDVYSFLLSENEYNTAHPQDRKVVIDGPSGRSLTFSQVKNLASRMAAGWQDKVGLKKGDIVASFAPNQYDHIVVYLSLLGANVTVTPGNPAYTEAEFHHQISNSGAKALVTVPELLPVLTKVCAKVGIPKDRIFLYGEKEVDGYKSVYSLLGERQILPPFKGINSKEDVAFICYSSGTTGLAKGVMLTHENFVSQTLLMMGMKEDNEEEFDDVVLGFLPFFHIFGLTVLCLNAFYAVTPVVVIPRFEIQMFCELIEKYKITLASIVPPVAVALAKHPIVTKYDLSSVRLLGCGAAPLGKEHIDALAQRMPALLKQGYGMTETTSGVITQKSTGGVAGSIGVLCPNHECKIVDVVSGKELGPDQEGELLMRGPSIMKGYLNNPKANAETFAEDGWMRTGDVCRFDSKAQEFFITDRLKELIKFKGFQVAPAELEALLLGLPEVADCCVIGVFDTAQATELPRAYVVPQAGVKADDAFVQKISDYVAKNVTNYKRLRGGVRFIDQVPKNGSGKIMRRQVREMAKKEDAAQAKAKL
ncbi:hypothetical protein BDB00DRAFT_806759 [Zychaea mexicana]|uniref:uncharacterized protein n=1 Tax=Zychaea mexicana TaxID=64656 RepID=UPI0022FEA079|nr:uncharacterized protein BDB00DRAFT_806759 [Zychaea mexicana]KAI9497097.1 hypothetical protein BDB00DRAFT_806759 [Zychaea mexicana]